MDNIVENNENTPLYVSSPLLPDLTHLSAELQKIWASGYVTNNGPYNQELEARLKTLLGVPTALTCNNGTIALLVALKMLDLPPGSEVITTPMTFAATAHSITWNGYIPVFADVLEKDMTIDPASVEKAVTEKTSAILATHVYGSICDYRALQDIANRYGLKLIFDAAHAFGAAIDGKSVGTLGDISIFSFHATKLFNTIEGGLITTPRIEDGDKINLLRNFGIKNEEEVMLVGINGKMNEIQAVIGLLNLELFEAEKMKRRALRETYNVFLRELPGITLQPHPEGFENSEQYFPVVIDRERFGRSRNEIYDALKTQNIFARKYFHPVCTDFVPYRNHKIFSVRDVPYVEKVKHEVLCLPFHSGVSEKHVRLIQEVFQGH